MTLHATPLGSEEYFGLKTLPQLRHIEAAEAGPVAKVTPEDLVNPRIVTQEPAGDDALHLVFSTDCSGYQHWQGIALWYSALEAGQRGPVTRIASGCAPEDRLAMEREWRAIDPTGRFRLHFTPHMELPKIQPDRATKGGKYPYSNKPGGLRHFLAHADPPVREGSFVALIDPDMLLLLPITTSLGEGLAAVPRSKNQGRPGEQEEFLDANGEKLQRRRRLS